VERTSVRRRRTGRVQQGNDVPDYAVNSGRFLAAGRQEVFDLNDSASSKPGEARPEKLPYEKPSILWEEEIDVRKTLAVACGKTSGRGAVCNAAPTS